MCTNAAPPNIFHLQSKIRVKIDTVDKRGRYLVKERRAYVIDEEGKRGSLEGFKVISNVPDNYPKIVPAE